MTFDTAEEAFYDALKHVPVGEAFDFVIHQEHCLTDFDDVGLCICTPQTVHHNHEASECDDDAPSDG